MLKGRPVSIQELNRQMDMISELKKILPEIQHQKIITIDDSRPRVNGMTMQLTNHIATLYPAPPLNVHDINDKKEFYNIIDM